MPFLAAPLIGLGGGLLSSKLAGKKTNEQKVADQALLEQTQKGTQWAGEANTRGQQFYDTASETAAPILKFLLPLLGGSRSSMLETLAPEVLGATGRMDTGRQSLLNLAPRTGGGAAMLDPYAKATATSSILQTARPQAAGLMQSLAQMFGNWGGQNEAAAGGFLGAGRGSATSLLGAEQARQDQMSKAGGGFADLFFNKILPMIPGKWGGGKK